MSLFLSIYDHIYGIRKEYWFDDCIYKIFRNQVIKPNKNENENKGKV